MSESINLQASTNTPISDGATALKLEDEVQVNDEVGLNETQYSENINESNSHVATDNMQETSINQNHDIDNHEMKDTEPSNGLENLVFKMKAVLNFLMIKSASKYISRRKRD